MFYHFQQKALFYLSMCFIGIFLLATNLPILEFQEGRPIPGAENKSESSKLSTTLPPTDKYTSLDIEHLPEIILFVSLCAVFFVLASMMNKIKYKTLLKIPCYSLLLWFLVFLLNKIEFIPSVGSLSGEYHDKVLSSGFEYKTVPIGDPPILISWILIGVLGIGMLSLIIWVVFQIFHLPVKEDLMIKELDSAIGEIVNGYDLQNVILRCYSQMVKVVKEENGIDRACSETPREFETFLASKGLPLTALHSLTLLFEKTRYGNKKYTQQDEQAALECLQAIKVYCSANRGKR